MPAEFHPEEFVGRFATWWAAPDPATLATVLADDVVLSGPVLPRTVGLAPARRTLGRLLAAIPDLTGSVSRWAASGDVVYIEFTLAGTLGGKPLSWENVDRFTVGPDGLATERVNFHDSLTTGLRMAGRPRGWFRLLRSGVLRRR